jgi:hypothetical protein
MKSNSELPFPQKERVAQTLYVYTVYGSFESFHCMIIGECFVV